MPTPGRRRAGRMAAGRVPRIAARRRATGHRRTCEDLQP
jgi:hypothetical protein